MPRAAGARNPYNPGMGTPPPFLAGRDFELGYFDELIEQHSAGGTQKHLILTGLRGVGKTVLLNEFEVRCEEAGWPGEVEELSSDLGLGYVLAQSARRALLKMSTLRRAGDRLRRAMRVVENFSVTIGDEITFKADLEPVDGVADSGNLAYDLRDLLVEVGEAALRHGTGFALILDEMHQLPRREMEALIIGLHRTSQKGLPIGLVGGGLPLLPELTGQARTYAERGFQFRAVGPLQIAEAEEALREPAKAQGISWTHDAIGRVLELTGGYPYFLQEYGRQIWALGNGKKIDLSQVELAEALVQEDLDASFFSQRIGKLSAYELRYLAALASLGDGPQQSGNIAAALGKTVRMVSEPRDRLMKAAVIYAPRRGEVDFTVPMCADYVRRTHPLGA